MRRVTIFSTITTLSVICFFILVASTKKCDECFSPSVMMIKFFLSGLVIMFGSIYFNRVYQTMEKIIFNIETLPLLETNEATSDVPFSIEGTIAQDGNSILKSPYTNTPCVYYHSVTEELQKRGKNSSWVVVENLLQYVPFYIADSRGKLRVDVSNMDSDFSNFSIKTNGVRNDSKLSEIDCTPILKHYNIGNTEAQLLGMIPTSRKRRRSEYVLTPSTKVFAYGYVSKQKDELVLHENPQHPLLISTKTKDTFIEEFYKGKNLIYFIHVLLALGFTLSLYSINYFLHLPSLVFVVILSVGNGGILASIVFTVHNRIIMLKQRALVALSTINVELKRRADLIPQIVTIVKEFAKYESDILTGIATMRVQMSTQLSEPEQNPSSRMIAIREKYPELKASQNYQHLMIALVDTEERIAYSRSFYNRNVKKFNTLITQFPTVLIALFLDMKKMEYVTVTST